jgi:general secretion pathway protein L
MNSEDFLIVILPTADVDDPDIWVIGEGATAKPGRLSDLAEDDTPLGSRTCIVLAPASCSAYYRVKAQGLEPLQEISVARINAEEKAIAPVQAAACLAKDGGLMVATIDAAVLNEGLLWLEHFGLNISAVVPMGAAIKRAETEVCRSNIIGHLTLHAHDYSCADEPGLVAALFKDAQIRSVEAGELSAALVDLARAPLPNFLDGQTSRKRKTPWLSDSNRLWIKRLSVLALGLLLLTTGTYWAKLAWSTVDENQQALALAQSIDPAITDVSQAEAAVATALARKGVERTKPAMLVAIVWQSVKSSDNLALAEMSLDDQGLLKATLAAPDAESINAALRAIERSGYRITAKSRSDQSGSVLADITVKAP